MRYGFCYASVVVERWMIFFFGENRLQFKYYFSDSDTFQYSQTIYKNHVSLPVPSKSIFILCGYDKITLKFLQLMQVVYPEGKIKSSYTYIDARNNKLTGSTIICLEEKWLVMNCILEKSNLWNYSYFVFRVTPLIYYFCSS